MKRVEAEVRVYPSCPFSVQRCNLDLQKPFIIFRPERSTIYWRVVIDLRHHALREIALGSGY
uniref:Uncharacterized protein n=1 Tax=Picea sitchensis TaxID=3332 RepID=B8LN26_PICSI|nr:unknown [Picea sitchensis]